ncbi:hypothetical protein U14_02841 [Candidatus Moduliflexus flocculans]|uniref:Sulfatase-modifying factor enzyme-like domain-containing protein n=1 Tax=Candidatus Moduliflexus flocculans TaxID=1499966 RepID=A0A081BMI0_9BACT|nr:hypothetical protein U14_02841 [Candidatus Moduliflexus flocculans]
MAENDVAKKERIRRWLKAILTEGTVEPLPARERALAGNLLAIFGDDRKGVGLRADGLPDIDWITIPAGEFMMGSDERDSEQPRHRVTFREPFQISRYPITNAQYAAFVDDKGYLTESYWTKAGWAWRCKENVTSPRYWDDHDVFRLSNHPVVGVSWYEAMAFCAWLTLTSPPGPLSKGEGELISPPCWGGAGGGVIRLPTEAEWEYAARGNPTPNPSEEGIDERYPWGDEITPEHANYSETNIGATSAVGCFPHGKSRFSGCEEMAGNVYEWCLDVWHKNYEHAPEDGSAWLQGGNEDWRVLRGGYFGDPATDIRCASRYRDLRHRLRYLDYGFRVVRSGLFAVSPF